MSGGFAPSVHLFSQSRGRLKWDEARAHSCPVSRPSARTRRAPAAASTGLAAVLRTARPRVRAAAAACGFTGAPHRFEVRGDDTAAEAKPTAHASPVMPGAKAFVDFQNDVTARDLALASREGFRSIEHVKRYTTAGMATDQGKTSNLNALGIVAGQLGRRVPEVGLTRPSACRTRR